MDGRQQPPGWPPTFSVSLHRRWAAPRPTPGPGAAGLREAAVPTLQGRQGALLGPGGTCRRHVLRARHLHSPGPCTPGGPAFSGRRAPRQLALPPPFSAQMVLMTTVSSCRLLGLRYHNAYLVQVSVNSPKRKYRFFGSTCSWEVLAYSEKS